MAWAHVQSGNAQAASGGVLSLAATFASAVVSGDHLVCGYTNYYGPTLTLSDTGLNAWTVVGPHTSGNLQASIGWAQNVTGGSSFTITGSFVKSYPALSIDEYTNTGFVLATDHSAGSNGTSTSPTTGAITVAGANTLIYAVCDPSSSTGNSVGAGFNSRTNLNFSNGVCEGIIAEDKLNVSTNQTATFTLGASDGWNTFGVSIKATVSGSIAAIDRPFPGGLMAI
jgi:hypothetical protein